MSAFIKVAELSEVPVGKSKTVLVNGRKVALFNVDGRIYATSDTCPDQGYSLGSFGTLKGRVVTCGLHYWEFDVTTGESADGIDERIATFEARVVDGAILMEPPPPLPCGQEECVL